MRKQKKILVIDDDREVAGLIELTMTRDGHSVIRTGNGLIGYKLAKTHLPDLIIMDVVMPGMDGLTLCQKLRQDNHLRMVPIVMVTGSKIHPNDKIAGLSIGADEYIFKPFMPQELSIRVKRLLKRTDEQLSVNPLTKLPGSVTLESEVTERIKRNKLFALCYFDIDHFKSFNDCYSYHVGDGVIKFTAILMQDTIAAKGNDDDILFHIGGDDFIILSTPEKVEAIYEGVKEEFSKKIASFYKPDDAKNGYITTTNRKGISERFPIMTLSAVAASNKERKITHYVQLTDILGELKKFAKMQEGYIFINDRRKDNNTTGGKTDEANH